MTEYSSTRINHMDFLINGTKFIKFNTTRGGTKDRILKLDTNQGRIVWNSNKLGVINLEWIRRVEFGTNPRQYQLVVSSPVQGISQLDLGRTLVIYYVKPKNDPDNVTSLHLIAPSLELGICWAQTLEDLITEMQQEAGIEEKILHQSFEAELKTWIKDYWTHCDTNRDGIIDFKEFKKFVSFMGVKLDDDVARNLYEVNDKEKKASLSLETLKNIYQQLNPHPEVTKIFSIYSKEYPSKYMTLTEFNEFLKYIQSTNYSDEYVEKLFVDLKGEEAPGINLAQFLNFLASPKYNPFSNELMESTQDMTQPLSSYFINSSHNTYLTGNQLKSQSSVSAYINALKDGCRCVELDCWDGPNNEPVVYHGYTLTSKILFKDIISAISEHAFDESPYPVILSLENHCSIAQQEVMARHLVEILGDKLCGSPLEILTEDPSNQKLPSPEQLKYKVLIKCSVGNHSIPNPASKSPTTPTETYTPNSISPPSSPMENLRLSGQTSPTNIESDKPNEGLNRARSISNKVSQKLAEINPYCQSAKFRGLEQTLASCNYNNIVSISESSIHKIMEVPETYPINAKLLSKINDKLLTRIYPAGNRVTSSNFNPLAFWLLGSQVVALNFQNFDLGMQLNRAMFPTSQGGGYVLKPSYMRNSDNLVDFESCEHKYIIDLHLISCHHLQNPKNGFNSADELDPFVEVELLTHNTVLAFNSGTQTVMLNEGKQDLNEYPPFLTHNINQGRSDVVSSMVRFTYKSRVVKSNGFNPKFNQKFQFSVGDLKLSFLRFKVSHFNSTAFNTLIGTFCIKLNHLNPGYQYLPIYNQYGRPIKFAKIFIWVNIAKYNTNSIKEHHTPSASEPIIEMSTFTGKGNQPIHMP